MLTGDQLQKIMPRLPAAKNSELLPFLTAAMTEFAIEAPARAAAFLAQLAHESGQFRFMEEIWGPTDAQRRYEPATTLSQNLGNTQAGDGKLFKGRGPIQLTGRANYKRFGDLLNVDLVANPPRAAMPDVAFRVAGLYWSKRGLNQLADMATDDSFTEITRRINGGTNGLADRQAFYAVARNVLGVPLPGEAATRGRGVPGAPAPTPEDRTFERGAEAIRAHEGDLPVRSARPVRRGKKRAAKRAVKRASKKKKTAGKKKSAAKSRARKTARASKSRTSRARSAKKR
jgi:predicted chitinase